MSHGRELLPVLLLLSLVMVSCAGPQGEAGPLGPAGPAGPMGPVGPAGEDAAAGQTFVGAAQCGSCHEEIYDRFLQTGHANALAAVSNGQPPTFPYDDITNGLPAPPAGYTWDDISYVIGGFGWMARFVDNDGYVITGETAQYNFANENLETDASWAAFHPGEQVAFDCARCHTTGYAAQGHQDNREGIDGTWVYEGVQCEKCHGPGSRHAEDPQGVRLTVDRSAQLCGHCHVRDEKATITAREGFAEHNQQFSDLYNSKHFALDCITCHDAHTSARYGDAERSPNKGISQACETCHWPQERVQNVSRHGRVTCIQCHMPLMARSAVGRLDTFTADIHAHQFSINPDPDAPQFNEDGTQVMPYLTLTYVCGQCHNGDFADVKEPAVLAAAARGYHTWVPPTATPEPTPESTAVPEATPTSQP